MVYDQNCISIEGDTDISFSEDVAKRYEAYGWHVIEKIDGHDASQIQNAITDAKLNTKSPTLILFNSLWVATSIIMSTPSFTGKFK